jgi:hypothetical protein
MIQAEKNTYTIAHSRDGEDRAILTPLGNWTAEMTRVAQQHKIREINLSAYSGWADRKIDFLRDLPDIEHLTITAGVNVDVSPIYDLKHLWDLGLAGEIKGPVEFPRIESLRELGLGNWNNRKYQTAFECVRLKNIGLSYYPAPDLSALSNLISLEALQLAWGKIRSLEGISSMSRLARISLQMQNQLESLDGISGLPEMLVVWIERAKKLKRLDGIGTLDKLRTLVLNNAPNLESLKPLLDSKAIEAICIMQTTSIADGDLAILKKLPTLRHVNFIDRKHYNQNNSDFSKMELPFY